MDNDYSELFYAASAGDYELVEKLVTSADQDEKNRALAQAAALSHFNTASFLIKQGADPNGLFREDYGTVLFPACEYVNPNGISFLLRKGADPRKRVLRLEGKRNAMQHLLQTHHRSPLHAPCVQLLLDAGASIPDPAVEAIHVGSADKLIKALDEDPEALTRPLDLEYGSFPLQGSSLLHLAVEFNQPELVQILLERGLDINHVGERIPGSAETAPVWPTQLVSLGAHSALFHAKEVSKELLPILLKLGADQNQSAPFLRDGEEVQLRPLEFFEAIDEVECNLLEEILQLKGY